MNGIIKSQNNRKESSKRLIAASRDALQPIQRQLLYSYVALMGDLRDEMDAPMDRTTTFSKTPDFHADEFEALYTWFYS